MSIESKPRTGLLEQLKAATTSEQITAIAEEFKTFKYASPKTVRKFERLLKQRESARVERADEA